MSRIIKLTSATMLVVLFTVGLAGCFGNFAATRKIYDYNQSFSGKWQNQVVFWVMNIVPVYLVGGVLDVLVFNTIEFWSGNNPIAMAPGEEVIKYFSQDGKNLKITIRQNEVIVEDPANPDQEFELNYKPLEKAWYYQSETGPVKIASLSEDKADFYMPSGKVHTLVKPQ
nr:hypothetical protein [Candidatus Cloacimonadota bacterium]